MSAHTPGPWRTAALYPQTVESADGSTIAVCKSIGGIRAKGRINARLIAAAPDLLEALRAIQHAIETQGDDAKALEHIDFIVGAALTKVRS